MLKIKNGSNILTIEVADTFFKRFFGLMGREKINQSQGLLLSPCNSVHMFFMRFSIDVIYIDESYVIKKIVTNLKPWIDIFICFNAFAAIEMATGEVERLGLN